jgi:N-acetylmuramoyl-L-alanine amidase
MIRPPPTQADFDTLARTLWGEARGEGRAGMEAVAAVILNRQAVALKRPGRRAQFGGPDVAGICRARLQFSCWNVDDPNYKWLVAPTIAGESFELARSVAIAALNGQLLDATGGADHYCVSRIAGQTAWAKGRKPTAVIGGHSFFKLEGCK